MNLEEALTIVERCCIGAKHSSQDTVDAVVIVLKEVDRMRGALLAIVARDPSLPGPKAAVVVSTSTMVAIAKQGLGGE